MSPERRKTGVPGINRRHGRGAEPDHREEVPAGGPVRTTFSRGAANRACLLLPAEGGELRQAVALAERAAAIDRTKYPGAYPSFRFVRGLAEYRQGQFSPAEVEHDVPGIRSDYFDRSAPKRVRRPDQLDHTVTLTAAAP